MIKEEINTWGHPETFEEMAQFVFEEHFKRLGIKEGLRIITKSNCSKCHGTGYIYKPIREHVRILEKTYWSFIEGKEVLLYDPLEISFSQNIEEIPCKTCLQLFRDSLLKKADEWMHPWKKQEIKGVSK